jgi:hypothetical protein
MWLTVVESTYRAAVSRNRSALGSSNEVGGTCSNPHHHRGRNIGTAEPTSPHQIPWEDIMKKTRIIVVAGLAFASALGLACAKSDNMHPASASNAASMGARASDTARGPTNTELYPSLSVPIETRTSGMRAPRPAVGGGPAATDTSDARITERIHESVTNDSSLSTAAKSVMITTADGLVTLEGMVHNDYEKNVILNKARAVAGESRVDNRLEVRQEK